MIRAILELELVYPYKRSITTLLSFNKLWGCNLLYGGTDKSRAIISMPQKKFKKMFKKNPCPGEYPVPSNAEKFISAVYVKNVEVE